MEIEKSDEERRNESERETRRFRRRYERNTEWVETVYSLSYVHPLYTLYSRDNVTNSYEFPSGNRTDT